jgi:PKHD-type hydroxylase
MVRNHEHRDQLFDLDQSIQSLSRELSSQHKDVVQLTGLYQRLIQQWAET